MNEIKGKFKITLGRFVWNSDREYNSPEYIISKETVDFNNEAYQNLLKNLGVEEKSTQNYYYVCIYPYVREYFLKNESIIESCKNGIIDYINIYIFIELADGFGYRLALFAILNKDGSSNVYIYPPFEKQAVERCISDEKDSIPEKDDKEEKKKDKYPPSHIIAYGILFMMLAAVLLGLIRAIYFWIIN